MLQTQIDISPEEENIQQEQQPLYQTPRCCCTMYCLCYIPMHCSCFIHIHSSVSKLLALGLKYPRCSTFHVFTALSKNVKMCGCDVCGISFALFPVCLPFIDSRPTTVCHHRYSYIYILHLQCYHPQRCKYPILKIVGNK